jgi:mRNA interferase MazF
MVKYIPDRGDIVWVEFDPQKGREIQKTRPALTVSPSSYNSKTGLGLFMPITSQIKEYPFEVVIEQDDIYGAILCDQVRSLDWKARNAQYAAKLSSQLLEIALAKFKVLLE